MRYIKLSFVVALFIFAHNAFAGDSKSAPDAKTWSEGLDLDSIRDLNAPMRVLISDVLSGSVDNRAKPLSFNWGLCDQVSYFRCVKTDNFDYAMKINKLPTSPQARDYMAITGANAIIFPEGERVMLKYTEQKEDLVLAGEGYLRKDLDVRLLFNRLFDTLGYDGVVLAVRGDYLLVGSLDVRLRKKGGQGVMLTNSSDQFALSPNIGRDDAVPVTAIGQDGGFAVFQLNGRSLPEGKAVGQKIILEERR